MPGRTPTDREQRMMEIFHFNTVEELENWLNEPDNPEALKTIEEPEYCYSDDSDYDIKPYKKLQITTLSPRHKRVAIFACVASLLIMAPVVWVEVHLIDWLQYIPYIGRLIATGYAVFLYIYGISWIFFAYLIARKIAKSIDPSIEWTIPFVDK